MTENTSAGVTAYTGNSSGEITGSRAPGAVNAYFVLDSLGSVVGLFDKTGTFAGGYSYTPCGETRASSNNTATNGNALRYIAGYFDSSVTCTGLVPGTTTPIRDASLSTTPAARKLIPIATRAETLLDTTI
jgi:hypothetical protein